MPTQDTRGNNAPPNVTMRQRAREYWWPSNRGVGGRIANIGLRVLQSGFNPIGGALNTARAVGVGEAREGIERAARNRGWDLNPFDNERPARPEAATSTPNAPRESWLPTFLQPRPRPPQAAPRPSAPPQQVPGTEFGPPESLSSYNHMPDPNSGPPRREPMNSRALPLPVTAPPQSSGAGRRGGTTIGGEAMARGIGHAHSGLGASSYGRDRMNQQQREG